MNDPTTQSDSPRKPRSGKDRLVGEPSPAAAVIQPAASADKSTRYVGLDVHKQQITYYILNGNGAVVPEGEIVLTRQRLSQFAATRLRPADRVALETTTNCWAVVEVLQQHVPHVVVSNPMATKAIAASKIKTDKVDARVLAQLLRCDFSPTRCITVRSPNVAIPRRGTCWCRQLSIMPARLARWGISSIV